MRWRPYGCSTSNRDPCRWQALHGFNVVLTFFAAAFLGVDAPSRWCITGCNCRGNVLLALSIALVLAGGVVTASCSDDQNWDVSWPGLLLQLASSTAYALKFTVMKMLLGNPVALRSIYDDSSLQPPNKFQIAFVASLLVAEIRAGHAPSCPEACAWTSPDATVSPPLHLCSARAMGTRSRSAVLWRVWYGIVLHVIVLYCIV